MQDTSPVGQAIARRRKKLGLTQAQLADATGIDRGHISRLEAGIFQPTLPTLARIADALETTPSRLMATAA
jgi:transcriptional regulator with XRE-family HTH domain